MMWKLSNPNSSSTCLYCGAPLPPRDGRGRPSEYCKPACRQAAYRERQRAKSERRRQDGREGEKLPPRPVAADPAPDPLLVLAELAADTQEELRHLVRLMAPSHHSSALELVELAQLVRTRMDALTAGLVGHARSRRIPWNDLGTVLNISPETARRVYHPRRIAHQLRKHLLNTPTRTAPDDPANPPPPTAQPAETEDEGPPALRPSLRSSSHLAPVLSRLQRASGLSLRQIGLHVRVSPSYLSRVLTGECLPTWELAERIAQAVGADSEALRKVWEDDRARLKNDPANTGPQQASPHDSLHSALRVLHRRAALPSSHLLAAQSGGHLTEREVSDILRGDHTATWPQVRHLVLALDGVPDFFKPLWEQAHRDAHTGPRPADTPAHRVNRLLTAFGDTLTTSDSALTPNARLRRRTRAEHIRARIALTRTP
ncbi:helix-turn-helix transcriptional regulator [Streptomyces sp. NPDC047071]|uniref:helix-turn-helix domain-containing protein n=1 Tax=Streptomyces sp. NPDC047071 TaxID=3154808 RepID=UPI003455AD06